MHIYLQYLIPVHRTHVRTMVHVRSVTTGELYARVLEGGSNLCVKVSIHSNQNLILLTKFSFQYTNQPRFEIVP